MLNFVITLKDILNKDLVITEINNEKIDGMGKVSYDNDNNLILTIHHPNQPIQNYDVKKFDIIAKIAKHAMGQPEIYIHFSKVSNYSAGWRQMQNGYWLIDKFICKDIIATTSDNFILKNKEVQLYIKNLDEFIRTPDQVLNYCPDKWREGIKPIEIGEIKQDIKLSFCFNATSDNFGYHFYGRIENIIPYVKIEFQQEQNLEDIFEIINDFLVLYSLLTGKDESLDAITFPREYLCQQFLLTDRWNMNLNSEMTKYSVFNKHSLFPLFRDICSQWSKNCSNFHESIPISNDIFQNFFNHKNIKNYKLFFATRKMDKYQKFTTLYTCFEVLIRASKIIKNEMKRKTKKEREKWSTGAQIDYFMENYQDIKDFLNFIDKRILIGKYIQKIKQNRNNIMHGDLYKIQQDEIFICSLILELIVYFLLMKDLGIDAELLKNRSYVDFNIIKNLITERQESE